MIVHPLQTPHLPKAFLVNEIDLAMAYSIETDVSQSKRFAKDPSPRTRLQRHALSLRLVVQTRGSREPHPNHAGPPRLPTHRTPYHNEMPPPWSPTRTPWYWQDWTAVALLVGAPQNHHSDHRERDAQSQSHHRCSEYARVPSCRPRRSRTDYKNTMRHPLHESCPQHHHQTIRRRPGTDHPGMILWWIRPLPPARCPQPET